MEDFDGRGLSLMKMFTLTFPGFTGVLAGSNLSANLRTPTRSIAAGTLASLLFVLVTYAAICFVLAASVDRPVLKDPRVMIMDTAVATITGLPLGYVGVVCTTLSSALSYLLGAPRVLHAVVRDAPSVAVVEHETYHHNVPQFLEGEGELVPLLRSEVARLLLHGAERHDR